jgi:hypothetical protein
MEFDPFKRRLPVAVLATIALAGCGGSSTESTTASAPANQRSPYTSTVTYYPNGTRIIGNENNDPDNFGDTRDVLDKCDGKDLVEQTLVFNTSQSTDISRSVNHPACADRKLTPSDFK